MIIHNKKNSTEITNHKKLKVKESETTNRQSPTIFIGDTVSNILYNDKEKLGLGFFDLSIRVISARLREWAGSKSAGS